MPIQYEILEQEPGFLNVEITIPAHWLAEIQQVMLSKHHAQGITPPADTLQNDVLQQAMRQGVREFIDEHPCVPWEEPALEVLDYEPEHDLTFTTQLEILPEFRLCDYSAIKIQLPPVALPTEEVLLTAVYELWYAETELTPVERPVQAGDRVIVDLVGLVNDIPIPTSARVEYPLDIEEDTLFPGFSEQLIGLKAGDTCDVKVTLPEDYAISVWQGQEALYNVYIHQVYAVERPPLDDSFPALIGKGSSIEEMSERLYDEVLQDNQEMWVAAAREAVIRSVVSRTSITIPETLLDAEQTSAWERGDGRLLRQQGLPQDLIEQAYSCWMEQEDIRTECYWNLKVALVLRAIAQKEQISLSEQELMDSLRQLVETYGSEPAEIYAELQRSGQWTDFSGKMLLNKTVDFLLSKTVLICDKQIIPIGDMIAQERQRIETAE
jgi:trigger factor